jgi:hypothetical protein
MGDFRNKYKYREIKNIGFRNKYKYREIKNIEL